MAAPAYRTLPQFLIDIMDRIHIFPINAPQIRRPRYSVPALIGALLTHAPNRMVYAQELHEALSCRGLGHVWEEAWLSVDVERDAANNNDLAIGVRVDDATLQNIVDALTQSTILQLVLLRYTDPLFDHLLLPMRQSPRTTTQPTSSFTSTSTSSGTARDERFPKRLLERDGPSCLLTGTIHLKAKDADARRWMNDFAPQGGDTPYTDILQGAHIIPLSISRPTRAQTYLCHFSAGALSLDDLTSESLNKPDNGMMMEVAAHGAFDSYRISIECCDNNSRDDDTGFTCNLTFIDNHHNRRLPPKSLADCNGRELPFCLWQRRSQSHPNTPQHEHPNRTYLEIHLAIARILHASGAGEVIDDMLCEEEEMKAATGNLPANYDPADDDALTSCGRSWGPTSLSYVDRRLGEA